MVTYKRNEHGFTLLEITFAVVIVSGLTAIFINQFGEVEAATAKTQVMSEVTSKKLAVEEGLAYGDITFPYYDLNPGESILVEVRGGDNFHYVICGSHEDVDGWYYTYDSATDLMTEASSCLAL